MAKYWEGQYDIDTDWGGDESTGGKPLPGSAVQDVIKTSIKKLDTGKVGYITESDGTVYFSSSKEAFDNEEYMGSVVSTQRYSMDLKMDVNNKYVFLSSDTKKEFVWYFKTIEIATDSVYTETVTVEYKIENKTENVMKTFSTTLNCNSDDTNNGFTKVVMNLDEYLTNGLSSIEVVVKGLRTKQERTLQKDITIVTLDIEDTTDFSKPFENKLIVQTNINCTKGQLFFYEYRIDNAEEFVFDNTPFTGEGSTKLYTYNIDITELSEGKHVFEYKLYINIGGESTYYTATQRIEFIKGASYVFTEPQILIFSSYYSDEKSIAEDGNLIVNGASQYIPYQVKCAVYQTEVSTTNVEFYEVIGSATTVPITTTIEKGKFFNYSIQSMNYGRKTIKIVCKDIDENIINGDGRLFYINVEPSTLSISEFRKDLRVSFSSVGKDNNSPDKATWLSEVSKESAIFSETFDWSQGWTPNGLVLSNGCEVVFDYAPFPQQINNPTVEEAMEYVGGDKAFSLEIEFMVQNVTDENAVLCDMTNELSTNDCGLLITGSEIKFTTPGGESVSSRFKEGDMNRVAIVIRPQITGSGDFKGLVELYMNGVMSSIAKYNYTDKYEVFERNETGNAISKRLKFKGSEGADLVVKYFRTYNTVMSPDEVINNYIIYRDTSSEMLALYNKNNVMNEQGVITPNSVLKLGNIPIVIFVGRTVESELATGCGNVKGWDGTDPEYPDGYTPGTIDAKDTYWYQTLENTTNKKEVVHMDVIYYNPLDKRKNFKFVKAYITPQGTSSMYYPKKNYRIYTQKNSDTRIFFSLTDEKGNLTNALELDQMLVSNFGERTEDRIYEQFRGTDKKVVKKKLYSFKDNAQAVKCWCLKADFAETSSSHNTGVARLWGDTMRTSTVTINDKEFSVFKTNAQATIESLYNNNVNGDMPDIRTTIDGFPIVVFGARSYGEEMTFLGKYNFNNDKSTESVFGFCDIDNENKLTDNSFDYDNNVSGTVIHTLDEQLDQYMSCVETLDNGNILANFASMESEKGDPWDDAWEDAFEFRYPEIVEEPDPKDYQDSNGNWTDKEGYDKDYAQYLIDFEYWKNTHLKPFKHFAKWIYDTRWCDVNGNILEGLSEEEATKRKEKFATEKWQHIDVWKMAAYYIYAMRFGAVDQIVKNSMLTSEGPFAYNKNGVKYGDWDSTDVTSDTYGQYYKWYYINYDNDTVMGVKNDGSLKYGPEITRQDVEGKDGNVTPIYAGSNSTLWNNIENDAEFQDIIRIADRGISRTMTYNKAINMFDVEQVGKWCERIYNKDAEYKYINPYMAEWQYTGSDDKAEKFTDKLFMLHGSRTAHRRWWLSRRFNLLDGRWSSGDFATKYVEVKCDYGSIGDKFTAVAGANAYFGYQINNKTFGDAIGGVTQEYKANTTIDWELRKVINIGDPIAIYGSTDLLELNLQGISKNLSSVRFEFGSNTDLGNKLERFILSIPEEDLLSKSSYKTFADDEVGTSGRKTGFEKIKDAYPFEITSEEDFAEGGKYPTVKEEIDPNLSGSPKFYRVISENDEGDTVYTYFAKLDGGIRNYACNTMSFDNLSKLQELKIAGYMSLNSLNLSKNKFINDVDIRYSGVKTIDFGEGSRIKNFKASDKLTTLSFTNCENITLANIYINDTLLKNDGGKNISVININNSKGLNHNNDFRDFIIKWMTLGDISAKDLVLRGIKWSNVKVEDLEIIKKFLLGDENGKHALQCVITGIIEMGPDKITTTDLEMFDELSRELGGGLTIRVPYANIVLNNVKPVVVAGDTAEFTYTLFPNAETILGGNGRVSCSFVKETLVEDYDVLKDNRTNKMYKPIYDNNEVRPGIDIVFDKDNFSVKVNTTENAIGNDTNALLMVQLEYDGDIKFDVIPLTIKEPTYAVSGVINGVKNIGEKNTSYTYNLNVISNTNDYPIGTIDIEWKVEGEKVEEYLSNYNISEDKKTFTITTSFQQPDPTSELLITAKVINHQASQSVIPAIPLVVTIEKPLLLLNENVVLTTETNPIVFDICRNQGWATISDIVMTKDEAEAVTDIDTAFAGVKSENGWSFEEFKYFTNAKLTTLSEGAFANSDITSIILPENIVNLSIGVFENCEKLKDVQFGQSIVEIPERCFLNCKSIENFVLPDSIDLIKAYAFGGTDFEQILEKGEGFDINPKTIYITRNSLLSRIANNAFETEIWTPDTTTNKLNIVTLPKGFGFTDVNYNFTLSEYLSEIIILEPEQATIRFRDNLLFANYSEGVLVRAMPLLNDKEPIETIELIDTNTIYPYAFYKCDTIKNVVLSRSMWEYGLGIGAFYGSSIKTVDLSRCNELVAVQEYTFNKCAELVDVIFPMDAKLSTFGAHLFYECNKLSAITIPNTITTLTTDIEGFSYMFHSCNLLEEITLPDSLVTHGRYVIVGCEKLKKLIMPTYSQSIGSYDFIMSCPLLEEVVLPVFSYTNTDRENIIVNTGMAMKNPYSFIHKECKNLVKFTLNQKDNNKIMVEKNGILYKVGDNGYDGYYEIPKTLYAVPYKTESTFILDEEAMAIDGNAVVDNNCITKIIIHSGVTTIPQNTFQNCENLKELHLLGEITMIDRFALCHCNNLSKIVLLTTQAPKLGHAEYVPVSGETAAFYKYHAFGYDPYNWTGYNTRGENKIYLPYNYKGYDAADWILPVFTEDQCSFEIEYFALENECVLTVYNENGEEITDKVLYFKSESGEFVFSFDNSVMSATYDDMEFGYVLNFGGKVYENETIYIYDGIDETSNLIGSFVAHYGVEKYTVGSPILSYKSRGLFSTTLFGSSAVKNAVEPEYINIKKTDYENLVSRVNQLTEQMNKLKKK